MFIPNQPLDYSKSLDKQQQQRATANGHRGNI
jgi:hypothetical protein